jgi:hypothetical protein
MMEGVLNMVQDQVNAKVSRRGFLQATTALSAAGGLSSVSFGQTCPAKEGTVRDRIWIFANPVNADHNIVQKRSVMSPFEAAVYMGVPNLIMVNQYPGQGEEQTFKAWESPYEQYAYPLKVLNRVVWSIVGCGGISREKERQEILAMAQRTPNITGVFMDDFFIDDTPGKIASLTLDQVRDVQKRLRTPEKKLDLYVTLYTKQLIPGVRDYLDLIDVVTLWTWDTSDIADLETNLKKLEQLAPKARKLLGCYTAALNSKGTPAWTAMPVPTMQHQCETGLKWLREGRIDGIIIYGTAMDLGWDSVEWAREWIRKVGDTKL